MIVPDINLLIYAYDSEARDHERARRWWQECMGGSETIGLALVVLLGFVRIVTNPRAMNRALGLAEATELVREWLEEPVAFRLDPGPDHLRLVFSLLELCGTAGNLVSDAQIAAVAIEHGGIVHSADADFSRFPGVRWFNPIAKAGKHRLTPNP